MDRSWRRGRMVLLWCRDYHGAGQEVVNNLKVNGVTDEVVQICRGYR